MKGPGDIPKFPNAAHHYQALFSCPIKEQPAVSKGQGSMSRAQNGLPYAHGLGEGSNSRQQNPSTGNSSILVHINSLYAADEAGDGFEDPMVGNNLENNLPQTDPIIEDPKEVVIQLT